MKNTTTARTIRDAVRILDVLETTNEWITSHQFQLGLTTRRTFKALRLLQELDVIDTELQGIGIERFKVYRVRKSGLPSINVPKEEVTFTNPGYPQIGVE